LQPLPLLAAAICKDKQLKVLPKPKQMLLGALWIKSGPCMSNLEKI
jgi:hypothetical protein